MYKIMYNIKYELLLLLIEATVIQFKRSSEKELQGESTTQVNSKHTVN